MPSTVFLQRVGRDCCFLVVGILLGSHGQHLLPSSAGGGSYTSLETGLPSNFERRSLTVHTPRGFGSSVHDQQIFAEMAVHPGMLTATPPGTVAIVLAGGAVSSQVICEVLKHQTVNRVLLFPPPTPTTAGSATGASKSMPAGFSVSWACADDGRVHETQWARPATPTSACDTVDVLIIDALPDGDGVPTSTADVLKTALYWDTVQCLLTKDASLLFQLGPSPTVWRGSQSPSAKARTAEQLDLIRTAGAALAVNDDAHNKGGVFVYDTFVDADSRLRSFAVVCRSAYSGCGTRWNKNEAAVELSIQRRMQPRDKLANQSPAFRMLWYDGATQVAISSPSRAWEDTVCAGKQGGAPDDSFCQSLLAAVADAVPVTEPDEEDVEDDPELSAVRYGVSGAAAAKGETIQDMGIFAVKELKRGSRLLYDASTSVEWPDDVLNGTGVLATTTNNTHLQSVIGWLGRYSYGCVHEGGAHSTWSSAPSRLTMINHACTAKEANVGQGMVSAFAAAKPVWDVARARHQRTACVAVFIRKDVKQGEQLRENYDEFQSGSAEGDKLDAERRAAWCVPTTEA